MAYRALLCLLIVAAAPPAAPGQDVVKRVGNVTFSADTGTAYPGGVVVVRLQSRWAIGTAYAVLEGRRVPFYPSTRGPRALVPISVATPAGPTTLGIEVLARRGRQRVPLDIEIGPRDYPPRTVVIPEAKRLLLDWPSAVRDGRQLLSLVRTHTPLGSGISMLRPPITIVDGEGFGRPQTWIGGSPVESLMDGLHGEHHRGLDYVVPVGTVVMAPAAGTVIFTGNLTLTGKTLVVDHGQGVVSALFHLYRIEVREGDRVESRAAVGLSGDTGLAVTPQVQWRVYLHGLAVDPRALDRRLD